MCDVLYVNVSYSAKIVLLETRNGGVSQTSPGKFWEIQEITKFREIVKNVGKFSQGKFPEIFPRIFLHFQVMKRMLQP